MALDLNDPEVKAAIEAEATRVAEATIKENYVPVGDIEGLKNKNQELLGKLVKFKGVDEKDVEELARVKQAREHDQFVDMVLNGKTEEAKAMLTQGVVDPWKQKTDELNNQFKTAQETISEYKGRLEQAEGRMTDMQKRQYLRELTAKDDSFKADHFDDFYMLNSGKMDIDAESGNVYALDANGKPILDTEGNKVQFSDQYSKMKVSSGLFWEGGSGSGAKGGSLDGTALPKNPYSWTSEQKQAFMKEKGPQAYGTVLSEWNASQRG